MQSKHKPHVDNTRVNVCVVVHEEQCCLMVLFHLHLLLVSEELKIGCEGHLSVGFNTKINQHHFRRRLSLLLKMALSKLNAPHNLSVMSLILSLLFWCTQSILINLHPPDLQLNQQDSLLN